MPLCRSSLTYAIAALPTTALLLATYFYNRPLPLSSPQKASRSPELSHSFKPDHPSSRSLSIVNPRNHTLLIDSRSITFSKSDIVLSRKDAKIGDEEILARFVKGFFGGWSFVPERTLLEGLRRCGRKFIEVKFRGG